MAVLPRLLHPAIVNERISRLNVINDVLQTAFGIQLGGPSVRQSASRRGSYDVFNDTRDVATAVMPGSHAATIARHPVGNVPFQIPRSAEKLPLLMEELNQIRAIGGPVDGVDELGERYIMDQEKIVRQRSTNLREFQCSAMLRGSYTYTQSGTDFVHTYTGGQVTVDFQIPSGNKSQLNMLAGGDIIGTTWSNAASPIVRDLLAINSAFNQLVGRGLTDVWITSVQWGNIITNTEVQALAGSVNNPVQSFTRDETKQEFTGIIVGAPWVTFHIADNGLNVNGTFTKLIADTAAVFTCKVDSTIVQAYECPEPVKDPVSGQMSNQYGEYYYHSIHDDPVSYEFHSRYNVLPVLLVPAAIAYGTVQF
jgi:hypothetical protein